MILLHVIKMTTSNKTGLTREDVTFFTRDNSKIGAIEDLAKLSRIHGELGERIVYHLLHVTDLGPWDCSAELFTLNGTNLLALLDNKQDLLINKS